LCINIDTFTYELEYKCGNNTWPVKYLLQILYLAILMAKQKLCIENQLLNFIFVYSIAQVCGASHDNIANIS